MAPAGPNNNSPGNYNYILINTVPGWATVLASSNSFSIAGAHAFYLQQLILQTFSFAVPNGTNPLQGVNTTDGWNSMDVTFAQDLAAPDVVTLTNLVNRMSDYFIVTTDGVNSLGVPAIVSTLAGVLSSIAITVVYKQGDGTTRTGLSDNISIVTVPISIDNISGKIDSNTGTFKFTFGVQTMKGTLPVTISVGLLPPITLNATWT